MATCTECGADVTAGKFCGNCGARLGGEGTGGRGAEQRHLTVAFCDLVGSTQMSEQLDSEAYHDLLLAYQRMAGDAVRQFDGHVAQYLGDGILIYFGYPTAHEDDPRRALLAAMAILDGADSLNETGKHPPIAVRLGVHAGMVIAGEIGAGKTKDDLALGLAPNVAARLQAVAKPSTIVVSDTLRAFVQGFFSFDDLGTHRINGVSEPMALYAVTGIDTNSRYRASIVRGLTPFVGRDSETALLSELWQRTCEGSTSVALIRGEGGIGKSRLTRWVTNLALGAGAALTDCECSALHTNTMLFPVVELLKRVLRVVGEMASDARLERLERFVVGRGLDAATSVPLLGSLLGIPFESRYATLSMGPELQREATLKLLIDLVKTARKPHLLVFEDLQWADATTLELVRRLVAEREFTSIMIVVNARPEFDAAWLDGAAAHTLSLEKLPATDLTALIDKVANDQPLPQAVVDRIVRIADGIPLFAEELTKAVLESIRQGHDASTQGDHIVPESLNASLMARLDRLGSAKEVAQRAAVLGREFRYDILLAIANIAEDELRIALERLIGAGLVFVVSLLPRRVYQFNHALVQVAAYESLLRRARTALHCAVVDRLEAGFSAVVAAEPELLARHCEQGGLAAKATDYWFLAGRSAFARSANVEAVAHLRSARALLEKIDDPVERAQRELAVLSVLGPALIATTGFASDDVGDVYTRARELCDQATGKPETFPVLAGSWVFYLVKGELETSRRYAEEMLSLGQHTGDDHLLVEAHYALGNSLYWLGELDQARRELEAADAIYDPARHGGHVLTFGQDPGVTARCYLTFTYWMLGRPEDAWRVLESAVATAEPLNHPFTTAWPMAFYVLMHSHRDEPDEARPCAEKLIAFALEEHQVYWLQAAIIVHGWALARRGDLETGIAEIRKGIAAYAATGAGVSLPHFHGLLAEVLIAAGRLDEAKVALSNAFKIAAANGERVAEIALRRIEAELSHIEGNGEAALVAGRLGVAIAEETGAWAPGLRAASTLHRLLGKHGDATTSPLGRFVDRFAPGTATPDLTAARRQLTQDL